MKGKDAETLGCALGGIGCWMLGVIANIAFWGALLWVAIQILKGQGVIH